MMDMEYNRTSPFISNCLHYSSEFHPYVGEFDYICIELFDRMNLDVSLFETCVSKSLPHKKAMP